MRSTTRTSFLIFSLFFQIFIIIFSYAADTISSGQGFAYPKTLDSNNGEFQLGLIDPGNDDTYYMAILFNRGPFHVNARVWVANRDAPYNLHTSELKVSEDGNLVLVENSTTLWSTNLTSSNTQNSTQAVLQDDGNFVLRSVDPPFHVLWQSFDNPTDTLLPGGRIGYDKRTNKSQVLTSWKNPSNPAKGVFTLELDPIGDKLLLKNGTRTHWSSGPWDGRSFTQATELNDFLDFTYIKNENESYVTYRVYSSSILYRFIMQTSGQFTLFSFDEESLDWTSRWSQPRQACDVYAYCGAFSECNQNGTTPSCQCIFGFEPRDSRMYESGNYSAACSRKTPLQCGNQDNFLLSSHSRLLGNQHYVGVANSDGCKLACLNDCSCNAYAYTRNCSVWNGDLLSLHKISDADDTDGADVYIRLASSELQTSGGNNKGSKTRIIVGAVAAVIVLGLAVSYIMLKKWPNWKVHANQKEDLELPLFDRVTIETATKQFSLSNKVGQGGFGPVYKGVLPTGEEIAIKRLSNDSMQGLAEFMNEVVLIAKLQHRNLVRLLGCCIHGEERMLIYEYMPNKSLDSFIFDKTRSVDLNWTQRFNIIIGIARGLLYLHQDSRLIIIHRDLKASNVLLDGEMNPRISDFGIARSFGGDQTEDNTNMIVGTHGYMAPEYATEGLFSMKSDVFSFGVLLLEIVSGKKNRGFHHASHNLNLLGHTWNLVNDDKTLELMDESMKGPFLASEVLRCIQVGLLCVQTFPEDRPTMTSVVSMLDSDGAVLPSAKQPGHFLERSPFIAGVPSFQDANYTINEITFTLSEGR